MLLTDNESIKSFCKKVSKSNFITVDTEFLRERTYWAKPCLIQIAGEDDFCAIDLVIDGLDLKPVYDLLSNKKILKIFHSGRQDVEILFRLMGSVPVPIFDTQIAAMVCGYGESISYESLVKDLTSYSINKKYQFMDWTKRPLTKNQLDYALKDVIYLREIYTKLSEQLTKSNRADWLEEELSTLINEKNYIFSPHLEWKKLKIGGKPPAFLAIAKEVAAWREVLASEHDLPKRHILRDDTLLQLCQFKVQTKEKLLKIKNLSRYISKDDFLQESLLDAIKKGIECKTENHPNIKLAKDRFPKELEPAYHLLKSLLISICEKEKITEKLILTSSQLKLFIENPESFPDLHKGWRYELFGKIALDILSGHKGLKFINKKVSII